MKCPNCKKEMKKSSKFERRSCIDEDGFGLDFAYMKVFIHSCKDCKIKYREDEFGGPFSVEDEWILPKKFEPSEKQITYAESIGARLGKDTSQLVTKQQYWKFINDNTKKYKKKKSEDYDRDMECLGEELLEMGIDESDFSIYN